MFVRNCKATVKIILDLQWRNSKALNSPSSLNVRHFVYSVETGIFRKFSEEDLRFLAGV